nr:MAG TPA: hypothetical protein [Caudoviricetes sp.]
MKNIEKYKDIVLDNMKICDIDTLLRGKCTKEYRAFCEGFNCTGCKERFIKWLLEEAKEPVLDDTERKYLSEVIRPFKNYVTGITKVKNECETDKQFIRIMVNKYRPEYIILPYFEENTMYKCMKENKEYSLEELGL